MSEEFVRIVAFDQNGEAHPVALRASRRKAVAPYHRWALVNLGSDLCLRSVSELNQTQSRILLALVFSVKPLRLKDLALIVGAPTSQVCREAKRLVELGLLERLDQAYSVSPVIRWTGKWKPNKDD